MNLDLREPWTIERFLEWEDQQEGKHEFDGTQIIDMTGGSRAHQRIVANLLRLLEDSPNPDRFDVVQEMRIDVGGKIRYPDIAIVQVLPTRTTRHCRTPCPFRGAPRGHGCDGSWSKADRVLAFAFYRTLRDSRAAPDVCRIARAHPRGLGSDRADGRRIGSP